MQVKGNLVENATFLCYIEERSATEGSLLGKKISPNQCIFPFVHHCTGRKFVFSSCHISAMYRYI
jgi:hypothetical protein